MKRIRRSMVVIPGNVPEYLDKCRKLDADVLIFDLQDAIAKSDKAKAEARDLVVKALHGGGFRARELCVRVNSPGTSWIAEDIPAIVNAGVDSIMLSHCYSAQDVLFAENCLYAADARHKIETIIEIDTPAVLEELHAIAQHARTVTSIAVGSYDFSLELNARVFGPDGHRSDEWLSYCRGKVVSVARWQGWNAGDFVSADPRDAQATKDAMHASRGRGFDGATIIFPRAIELANDAYGVSTAELAWAQDLVSRWRASDKGPEWNKGARSLDGEMVFTPTYEYACRVIALHGAISGDAAAMQRFRTYGAASTDYLLEKRLPAD